jgi:hypothetical protein
VVLALIGGGGVGAGALAAPMYPSSKRELVALPALAWGNGIGAALLIGTLASLWSAPPAARMPPTQALWSM